MSFVIPLVAETSALRLQVAGQDEELCLDRQERRLYSMDGATLGGIPAWHTDLLDATRKKIIAGVVGDGTNWLQATASSSGSPVRLTAEGGDANLDLYLLAKGTGAVRAGPSGSQVRIAQRLGANPASPVNGEQIYRTDLEDTFVRRLTIAKWLAERRDHIWTFNATANGAFGRMGAFQATATLGVRVDYPTTVSGIGWNLELSGAAAGSALDVYRCDGVPNLLFSQAVGGTLSGFAAIDQDMVVTSDYGLRWNDGGAGVTATGFVTLYLHRRAD